MSSFRHTLDHLKHVICGWFKEIGDV